MGDYADEDLAAEEELRTVAAEPKEAEALGPPLLEIRRLARRLDGAPVELRISRCESAKVLYVNHLH